MKQGLFLNSIPAQCSIYESGKMIYDAITNYSNEFTLDYLETTKDRVIPTGYDFYVINWHPATLPIQLNKLRILSGKKIAIVLEVSATNILPVTPIWFDAYMVIDPTKERQGKIYPFPRPLEIATEIKPLLRTDIPVIGTFGFYTVGKRFNEIIDIYNANKQPCIIRMNIPFATFTSSGYTERDALIHFKLLSRVAKRNISLEITHKYMSKQELISWCSQNSINVFPYYRDMPGLCAVTDQAISAGRGIGITECSAFRHLRKYISYYPKQSYLELSTSTLDGVKQMQEDWHPQKFADSFKNLLIDQKVI